MTKTRPPAGRAAVWLFLFRLSVKTMPGMTVLAISALIVSMVILPVTALTLRNVTNVLGTSTSMPVVVTVAIAAALACAIGLGVDDAMTLILRTAADRLGRLHLHPLVHRTISEMTGIEHLERSDYLDRVVIARGGTSALAGHLWNSATAVANVGKVILTAALLATTNPLLVLLAVLAAAPGFCYDRGQRAVARAEVQTAEDYRLQQHFFDMSVDPAALKDVRLGNASGLLGDRQAATWSRLQSLRVRAQAVSASWTAAGWLLFVAGFVGGLLVIAAQASAGRSGPGDLVLAIVVAATLQNAVAAAVKSVGSAFGASRVIEPFSWLRAAGDRDRAVRESAVAVPPARLEQGIDVRNVSFSYPGTDTTVLDDVSVTIPPASVVAIVGEYGSGKTTLVKLLTRFYDPSDGSIEVDGTDIRSIRPETWRQRTTAAFQDFGKFRTVIRESIAFGDLDRFDDVTAVRRAVGAADADSIIELLPHGLDTQLGTELGGVDLSEGQWQRVALARAAMREDPLLVVLDEPTASIDAPTEERVFRRFMDLSRRAARRSGAVTVLVSHRFSTVTEADLILVMRDGRIVESGTHDELLARAGGYAEMFQIQVEAYAEGPKGES